MRMIIFCMLNVARENFLILLLYIDDILLARNVIQMIVDAKGESLKLDICLRS